MKKKLVLSMLVILLLLIFFNSDYIIKNIIDYTKLFITNLAFYTLIMYVIASLLVDYDLLEVLNPKSFITIMSMLSGFPSGAKYTKDLVDKGYISYLDMVKLTSYNAAKILGIDKGYIEEGSIADITIFNPNEEYIYKKEDIVSKSKNTPFIGKKLKGRVYYTIVNGNVVYRRNN